MRVNYKYGLCIALAVALLFFKGCKDEDQTGAPDAATGKITDIEALKAKLNPFNSKDGGSKKKDAGTDSGVEETVVIPAEDDALGLKTLAQEIRERRRSLALREREVTRREQLLASLETAVLEKSDELQKVKAEILELLNELRDKYKAEHSKYEIERLKRNKERSKAQKELLGERDKRIIHLVATIKGMRASSGADLLASMDDVDAVEVLRQLGPRQAAAILGGMPPNKAAKLAESMLGPRELSKDFLKALPRLDDLKKKGDEDRDAGPN